MSIWRSVAKSKSESSIRLQTKIPGPQSLQLMKERNAAVARGPFHVTPVFIKRAKGALIEDVDGNQFIDFASGIGVTNLGHAEEDLIRAIKTQADAFFHSSFNVTPYEVYIRLCEKLNEYFPLKAKADFQVKSFLANSGAEAVENAIKMARAYTKRQSVICFDHAFHGRTYMAMTLTSKYKPYKYGFAPFNPEVYRAPFPYVYRWPTSENESKVSTEAFRAFENLVSSQLLPSEVAAVIIEPVLGEGGFVPAPKEYLKKLRDYCTKHGIVLIADEIQSGFGRTGTLFACEQMELVPDLLLTAKGLGGGMPISAVTGREEILDAPIEGAIGGTFNGNPLSCVSALEVFRQFENKNILEKSQGIGEKLVARLQGFKSEFECLGDVRGLGLMRAMEFVKSRATKEPAPELAKSLVKFAYEHGVICMAAGTYGNVVRLLMPLIIRPDELDEGLQVLEAGLKTLSDTA